MKTMAALLAGTALMMMTSSAMATVVNMETCELPWILDDMTLGWQSGVNPATDFLADGKDARWRTHGAGSTSATMIMELAGQQYGNSFGIYDPLSPYNTVELFSGSASAGHQSSITFGSFNDGVTSGNLLISDLTYTRSRIVNFTSTVFGFYLRYGSNIFYSDTAQNADSFDHMVFYGKPSTGDQVRHGAGSPYTPWLDNEYLVGIEDLYGGGDRDYDDMVIMLGFVTPVSQVPEVPEPGTLMLLGGGLLGLAIYNKRRA